LDLVKALSFKFMVIMHDIAAGWLERLSLSGDYRYNVSAGENRYLRIDLCLSATEMTDHLFNLPRETNSGDIHAAPAASI
jgi:hypothetical protein